MKRDAAVGIALMVAGILGLIFPPQFKLDAEQPVVKPAHVLRAEPTAQVVLLKYGIDASTAATAANCSRKLRAATEKASLLDKVGVVLADLDSVVSLQGMASGM